MTELNTDARARAALANLTLALVERGTPPNVARRYADTAEIVSVAGTGCLLQVGEHRAIDTPESMAALASILVNGPAAAADAPADDAASHEAARRAGAAAGAAQRAAGAVSPLCFK